MRCYSLLPHYLFLYFFNVDFPRDEPQVVLVGNAGGVHGECVATGQIMDYQNYVVCKSW